MIDNTISTDRRTIDVFKGICILFVIITHYNWTDAQRLNLLFPFWIDMAVPIFMIISGYVYSLSFTRHSISSLSKAYSFNYILRRFIRYTIPFLIVFILELIPSIIGGAHIEIQEILLLFLRGANGPGGYYYPLLLQLIFVFPIVFFIIQKFDMTGVIICFVINSAYEVLKIAYYVNEDCYRLLIFRYIMLLAFGCYFAIGKKKLNRIQLVSMFLIGVFYIILIMYLKIEPIITTFWSGTCFIASMYIVPLIYVAFLKVKLYILPLEIIGKASYNIFLVQMVYYMWIKHISEYSNIDSIILQLIINCLVILIAGVLFYYIEKPITDRIIMIISNFSQKKRATKL